MPSLTALALCALSLGVAVTAAPAGCSHVFKDSYTGFSFEKLAGHVFEASYGGREYNLTVCGTLPCFSENSVAEWVNPASETCVLGYGSVFDASWSPLDSSDPAKGVVVKYQGGACPSSPTGNPTSATLYITCDPEVMVPTVVDMDPKPDPGTCAVSFSFASSVGCGYDATPNKGLSGAVVAVIVILVLLIVYCGCGMAYKRVAVGASGMESVPNIGCWRATWRFVRHCGSPPSADNSAYQGVEDDWMDDDDDLPTPKPLSMGDRL